MCEKHAISDIYKSLELIALIKKLGVMRHHTQEQQLQWPRFQIAMRHTSCAGNTCSANCYHALVQQTAR